MLVVRGEALQGNWISLSNKEIEFSKSALSVFRSPFKTSLFLGFKHVMTNPTDKYHTVFTTPTVLRAAKKKVPETPEENQAVHDPHGFPLSNAT